MQRHSTVKLKSLMPFSQNVQPCKKEARAKTLASDFKLVDRIVAKPLLRRQSSDFKHVGRIGNPTYNIIEQESFSLQRFPSPFPIYKNTFLIKAYFPRMLQSVHPLQHIDQLTFVLPDQEDL